MTCTLIWTSLLSVHRELFGQSQLSRAFKRVSLLYGGARRSRPGGRQRSVGVASAASISSLTGLYVAAPAARPGTSRVLTMDGCCMASSSASKAPCESNHPDPQPELTYACRLAGLVASWLSHARLSSGGELQGPQVGTGKMSFSPGGLLVDFFVVVGRRPPVSWPIIHRVPSPNACHACSGRANRGE